jgi:AcrR family transcriptional regulator
MFCHRAKGDPMTITNSENDGDVRQRLLASALGLFTSKGFAATSVREIVAAAGVTKPVLYYYYGSKEGLYLALMTGTYADFAARIDSLAAHRGTARERLVCFCSGILDGFIEHIDVARLIYAIYFGPPQGAPPFRYEEPFERMLQIVGSIVGEGIAAGELRQMDTGDATWAVVGILNTIMEEQICHDPPRVDRDGLVRILNLIIDGLSQGR